MTHDNKLQVEAIKRGTVIDHIPAQIGFKLLTLFKLTETDQRITIGLNLPSGEMGRKDLIKIENTFLTDEQVNQLALYAPHATVNRIDEIATDVDKTPHAWYFQQAGNGIFARQALLALVLNRDLAL